MAKKEFTITGVTVLTILIGIFFINQICIAVFLPLLILSIIALIVAGVITYQQSDYVLYAWLIVGALIILTLTSYACGYGFYKTDIGKTLVDAGNISYEAVNTGKEASEEGTEIMKNTSKEIIDLIVNATDPTDPNIKNVGEIGKDLIDIAK